MKINKLDNPAWYSLTETHQDFAIDLDGIKFYKPEYCSFGGYLNSDNIEKGMENYASQTDNFYVIGNKPFYNDKLNLNKELVCNQMVLDRSIELKITTLY